MLINKRCLTSARGLRRLFVAMSRPRFSLLALVLFSLLAGSVVVLVKTFPVWRPIAMLPVSQFIYPAPTGRYLLSHEVGGRVLYDKNGMVIHRFQKSDPPLSRFSPGDVYLVKDDPIEAKASAQCVELWNIAERKWAKPFWLEPDEEVFFTQRSRWAIARKDKYTINNTIRLIDVTAGKEIHRWINSSRSDRFWCSLSKSGNEAIILIHYENYIERWDMETRKLVATTQLSRSGEERWRSTIRSSDLDWIGLVRSGINRVQIFNTVTGQLASEINIGGKKWTQIPHRMFLDGEHDELAVILDDSFAGGVWDLRTGQQKLTPFEAPPKKELSGGTLGLASNGRYYGLFSGGHLGPTWVQLWDRETLSYRGERVMGAFDIEVESALYIDRSLKLIDFHNNNTVTDLSAYLRSYFLPGQGRIVSTQGSEDFAPHVILAPCRPKEWWGVAWLPAFWSTAVLVILFLWCVFWRKVPSA